MGWAAPRRRSWPPRGRGWPSARAGRSISTRRRTRFARPPAARCSPRSPMSARLRTARGAKGVLEAHYAELAKLRVPLGRVAHASEFADLFAFLVSERATYITGASVNFDGGSGMTV